MGSRNGGRSKSSESLVHSLLVRCLGGFIMANLKNEGEDEVHVSEPAAFPVPVCHQRPRVSKP